MLYLFSYKPTDFYLNLSLSFFMHVFYAREPLSTFILYFHCIAFLQVSFERKAVLSVNLCKIVGSLLHIKSKNRSWLIHVGSPFNSQNHPIFLSFCENLKISQPGTLHFKREI